MNKYWLFWLLSIVLFIAIPVKLKAEEGYVLQCDNGLCVASQSLLERLVAIAEYWKAQAQTCKGV